MYIIYFDHVTGFWGFTIEPTLFYNKNNLKRIKIIGPFSGDKKNQKPNVKGSP